MCLYLPVYVSNYVHLSYYDFNMYPFNLFYKLNLHNLVLSPYNDNNTYKLITTSGSQGNIYLYFSPLCQIM